MTSIPESFQGSLREDTHEAGDVRGLVTDVPERAVYWMISIAESMGGLPESERWRLAAADAGVTKLRLPGGRPHAAPRAGVQRVQLANGEALWLQERGHRSAEGSRTIEVLPRPRRDEAAMVALLTAMEGHSVKPGRAREMLRDEGVDVHREGFCSALEVPPGLPESLSEEQTDFVLLQYYVGALLDHFRPGFAELPHEQRLGLIEGTCSRVFKFLEALRQLVDFLEFGEPGRDLRPKIEHAARDVEAAILKDVNSLTERSIARRLGVPLTENGDAKSDFSTVTKMVKRGRSVLREAYGEDGWKDKARAMRSDAERYNSLSAKDRALETCAEILAVAPEQAERALEFKDLKDFPAGPERTSRMCDVILARLVFKGRMAGNQSSRNSVGT